MTAASEFDRVPRDVADSLLVAPADGHHFVHFYEEDAFLFDAVAKFLRAGLDAGDSLVVIATPEHRDGFVHQLRDRDVDQAVADGQLLLLDARETLAGFMVNGRPDAARFHRVLDGLLERAARGGRGVRVRAYGEMVDLLWRDGERAAAIALEELWNEAGTRHAFSLLCAYVMANFYKGGDGGGFVDVCRAHTHVLPGDALPAGSAAHLDGFTRPEAEVEISRLRERLRSVERELERAREVEHALRASSTEGRRVAQDALVESESRFHQLIDAISDYAIFMLDAEGNVATWSPGARKAKGYEAGEIIGRHFSTFYTAADRDAGRPARILETVRREGRYEEEGWRVRKDGSRFWAGVSIAALRGANGEVTGFAKVTRDLTSRREAEQRERAHQDLERVSRAKDEFLATMSHELRTPLNAILGWVTMLSMDGGAKPRDDAKLARGLQVIERSARAQERLVSDLLDMSRIVNGKLRMSMQRVKLAAVLHAAADVLRQVAAAKGVRLVVELDPDLGELLADPDRLQQVIVNLLTNALRHTPRDGRVTVRGERCDGGVRIRVEDTGAGIAAEHLPFIFDRFRQVDGSTTRAHGGLGLGLAIVRHLVEAHGGSVVANSDGEGRGATFTITLPVRAFDPAELPAPRGGDGGAERAAGASETATTHANLLCGVRVLVVDDHADSREIIGLALEDAGATVTTAACAQEALDASGPFDVIVSDIGMPGMDGYSLMKTIRSRNSGADIPAIALTAFASATDAEYARRCGYQEHLAKPVDPRGLIESVKTWARVKGDHSTSTSPAT